jgi:myo-inositol 2-dehydrogenase / D-chiro-inositol 1-dehydrogenase
VTSLAFAGAGRISIVHALAAQAIGAPIKAVASRSPERASKRAKEFGARPVAYDALPAGADVVVVATPPALHATHALQALAAGAKVVLEKPLCTTLDDADLLVAAAGNRLLYAENLAFAPAIERAVALAADLGPVEHLEVRALQGRPDWGDFLTAGWGGGALFDLGVHPLAVALLAAAPAAVVEVTATLAGADDIAVDDHAIVALQFDTGLIAQVEASWRAEAPVWDLQVASATGVVRAELIPAISLEHNGEAVALPPPRDGVIPELDAFGYIRQLEAAVRLSTGAPTTMTAAFGRHVLDIVCAAYASAGRSGAAVPVPFAGPRDRTPLHLWRP